MNLPIGAGAASGEAPRPHPGTFCPTPPLVLVADEEEVVRAELAGLLRRRGLAVLTAASGAGALRILASRPEVAVLVTDTRPGGMDGLSLAMRAAARRWPAEALEVVRLAGYVAGRGGPAADIAAPVAEALRRAIAGRAEEPGAPCTAAPGCRRGAWPAPSDPLPAPAGP